MVLTEAKSEWSGGGEELLQAVQCVMYIVWRVKVVANVREWYPVNVGLRQGCVMCPWLLNEYTDGVVREVNARMLGRGSACKYWQVSDKPAFVRK